MKKNVLTLALASTLLVGCSNPLEWFKKKGNNCNCDSLEPCEKEESKPQSTESFTERELNIYRKKDVVDKTMKFRFYEGMENVPYVSVSSYYKEFFNTKLKVTRKNHTYFYKYSEKSSNFLGFDAENDLLISNSLSSFTNHPDFKSSTGKVFLRVSTIDRTGGIERVVNLKNYSIPVYEDKGEAYVPMTLLSTFAGGYQLYNIAYNGKDVYIVDYNGELSEEDRTPSYYGDSYLEKLSNIDEERPEDLVNYTYNELCFVFDNLRGYTSQLVMGDNNLIALGLNGVLETYYPELKQLLLSKDKNKYYQGFDILFKGLDDGGHTGSLASFDEYNAASSLEAPESLKPLLDIYQEHGSKKAKVLFSASLAKTLASYPEPTGTYTLPGYSGRFSYCYNSEYKTSYIGFGGFDVDYDGWDKYYNGEGEVPVNTDAYAYVRSKLFQAKEDGAENIVLDISTNGGGSSYCYAGLIGLFNGAKAPFTTYDAFNKNRETENYLIDINLDGKFDAEDITEANKFADFNVGVLTSGYSFSCANLFPSVMKELGFKIMGEQSGGGSCAINVTTSGDGLLYVHSAYHCLSDQFGNNIDSGVPVDFEIEIDPVGPMDNTLGYSRFYDPAVTGTYLATAYN